MKKKTSKKSLAYVFVISFGFLNGLWLAIGINPQDEVFNFLKYYLDNLHPWIHTAFVVLPIFFTVTTIITLLSIYHKGGILGGMLVLLAFAAGISILKSPVLALAILAISYIIGLFVFRKR